MKSIAAASGRILPGTLLALLFLLCASPGHAEEEEMDEEMKRWHKMANSIEEITGFYLLPDEKRDPLEQVIVQGETAEIWFLHPMEGKNVSVDRCTLYRWFFFGRLHHSKGVDEIFRRHANLAEVKLMVFDIKTRIEPDGKRGYRQFRKTSPRMEITVTRERAMSLNFGALRARMRGPRCLREAERVVDRKWYQE